MTEAMGKRRGPLLDALAARIGALRPGARLALDYGRVLVIAGGGTWSVSAGPGAQALCRSPEAAAAVALALLVDWPAARRRRAALLGLEVTADGRDLDR